MKKIKLLLLVLCVLRRIKKINAEAVCEWWWLLIWDSIIGYCARVHYDCKWMITLGPESCNVLILITIFIMIFHILCIFKAFLEWNKVYFVCICRFFHRIHLVADRKWTQKHFIFYVYLISICVHLQWFGCQWVSYEILRKDNTMHQQKDAAKNAIFILIDLKLGSMIDSISFI